MEDNFKKQIKEDIEKYQEDLYFISNIKKDEWAFNYWILDKLLYEEKELIEEKIIEYIENNPIKSIRECAAIKAEVRSMLSSLLYDNTKRKPIIIVNFTLI